MPRFQELTPEKLGKVFCHSFFVGTYSFILVLFCFFFVGGGGLMQMSLLLILRACMGVISLNLWEMLLFRKLVN